MWDWGRAPYQEEELRGARSARHGAHLARAHSSRDAWNARRGVRLAGLWWALFVLFGPLGLRSSGYRASRVKHKKSLFEERDSTRGERLDSRRETRLEESDSTRGTRLELKVPAQGLVSES